METGKRWYLDADGQGKLEVVDQATLEARAGAGYLSPKAQISRDGTTFQNAIDVLGPSVFPSRNAPHSPPDLRLNEGQDLLKCFECGTILKIDRSHFGKNCKCSGCGTKFAIPLPAEAPQSVSVPKQHEDLESDSQGWGWSDGTSDVQQSQLYPQQTQDSAFSSQPIMVVAGMDGQIELYEDRIMIGRKGAMAFLQHGFKGDKEIFLYDIASVQLMKAGVFIKGYIQFFFSGAPTSKEWYESEKDANKIFFYSTENAAFQRLHQELRYRIRIAKQPRSITVSGANDLDRIVALEKLANLRDRRVISENEFLENRTRLMQGNVPGSSNIPSGNEPLSRTPSANSTNSESASGCAAFLAIASVLFILVVTLKSCGDGSGTQPASGNNAKPPINSNQENGNATYDEERMRRMRREAEDDVFRKNGTSRKDLEDAAKPFGPSVTPEKLEEVLKALEEDSKRNH